MAACEYSLAEIANKFSLDCTGDSSKTICSVATLKNGKAQQLGFFANRKYLEDLRSTQLTAVLVSANDADLVPPNCIGLISNNPYADYARVAQLFVDTDKRIGITATATVADSAIIGEHVFIESGAVVGENTTIGDNVKIGANCYIGNDCTIANNTVIYPNVSLYYGCTIGRDCIVHSGAVIGSDGFGHAPDKGKFVKVPQLGAVTIGNDVEVGACTTIDRGALDDTVIGDGVKLDNQIQIGHNAIIGSHTVIAGATGIAGSSTIGKNCMIGGRVGIAGHISIPDGTMITGATTVFNTIKEPGVYSSGMGHENNSTWRRNTARLKQLNDMYKRLVKLEKNNS